MAAGPTAGRFRFCAFGCIEYPFVACLKIYENSHMRLNRLVKRHMAWCGEVEETNQ